ncbi:hypothetical protein Q1695_002735 [Nippostrongylus brasiliensis]|nr:hypothetical protein Q1695_002735 [Nippostrongylus brasiliensis]
MIFINTRPLEEGIHYDRRPSKAPSHHSVHSHSEPKRIRMSRVVFCLLLFYLMVSIVPVLLHYPLSLVSLFVPCLAMLYLLCHMQTENRSDHWPCGLVAIIGILLKTAAVVTYIVVFPMKDSEKKSLLPVRLQARADVTMDQYRLLFFVVLVGLEIFLLLVGVCLKWHLVAFEKIETNVQKRRATLTSNQPLIPDPHSRRTSKTVS